MRVTILVSSLSNLNEYAPVIASINIFQEEAATWDYVSILFIKKQKTVTGSDTHLAVRLDSETPAPASYPSVETDRVKIVKSSKQDVPTEIKKGT